MNIFTHRHATFPTFIHMVFVYLLLSHHLLSSFAVLITVQSLPLPLYDVSSLLWHYFCYIDTAYCSLISIILFHGFCSNFELKSRQELWNGPKNKKTQVETGLSPPYVLLIKSSCGGFLLILHGSNSLSCTVQTHYPARFNSHMNYASVWVKLIIVLLFGCNLPQV